MSCCEKKYYDRMKDRTHVYILACQVANVSGIKQAVYKAHHGVYGDYYKFNDYVKVKNEGIKVLRVFQRGDTL